MKNHIGKRELTKAIQEAMPSRKVVGWHKRIQPIKDDYRLLHYITKARITGNFKGKHLADVYARKRLLFNPSLNLKKYGTIGAFWERPKKQLWKEIIENERLISEGLKKPGIKMLVEHVYQMTGETLSLKALERAYGYWSEEQSVKDWIETLSEEKPS